jgi:hypothetical protein
MDHIPVHALYNYSTIVMPSVLVYWARQFELGIASWSFPFAAPRIRNPLVWCIRVGYSIGV